MKKLNDQLISIARHLILIQANDSLRRILKADVNNTLKETVNDVGQSINETKENVNNAKTTEQKNKYLEQFKKKTEGLKEINEDISQIRKTMEHQVSNWNSALKQIYDVLRNGSGFSKVIDVLGNSEYFIEIGADLQNSFKSIPKKLKDGGVDLSKISFADFEDLIKDKQNGWEQNIIDPFVQMYNGYMDAFESVQKEYNKLYEQSLKNQELYNKMFGEEKVQNTEQGEVQTIKNKKIQKKFNFKSSVSRQLLAIAKMLR